jgi:uncharacterized integral membrane protein
MEENPYAPPLTKPKLASLPPVWYAILGLLLLVFVVIHSLDSAIAICHWLWYLSPTRIGIVIAILFTAVVGGFLLVRSIWLRVWRNRGGH